MTRGYFDMGLFRMGLFWFGVISVWGYFGLGLLWFGVILVGLFRWGYLGLGLFHTVAFPHHVGVYFHKISVKSIWRYGIPSRGGVFYSKNHIYPVELDFTKNYILAV